MSLNTKVYLLAALRIANADILPFDWRATCAEFLGTIDRYEQAAEGLADLADARAATQRLDSALARLAGANTGAAARNAALHALGRIMVPLNFTREPRFRHDLAYTVPPLPGLAVAAELPRLPAERRRSGQVELMRGQNRFIAAIDAARRIVEAAAG
ncbi:MAG TPA: hypothetical protein VFW75_14320 [Acetobacteraceae bacterium]|nr:hypothetical protein [Acetobacteraceae bacterium]